MKVVILPPFFVFIEQRSVSMFRSIEIIIHARMIKSGTGG